MLRELLARSKLNPRLRSALQAFRARTFARLDPRSERALAVGLVALLHVLFVAALMMRPSVGHVSEVSLVLVGGPLGKEAPAQKLPDLAQPQPPDTPPPVLEIATPSTMPDPLQVAPGSPNVSRPAMAIATEHEFPKLPSAYAGVHAIVRLLLSIAQDGTVSATAIAQSSGAATLDQIATEWVRSHWRYMPALENGSAVASKTMAIVTFTG